MNKRKGVKRKKRDMVERKQNTTAAKYNTIKHTDNQPHEMTSNRLKKYIY